MGTKPIERTVLERMQGWASKLDKKSTEEFWAYMHWMQDLYKTDAERYRALYWQKGVSDAIGVRRVDGLVTKAMMDSAVDELGKKRVTGTEPFYPRELLEGELAGRNSDEPNPLR